MIVDMISNKKRNPIVTQLYFRSRKLNTFLAFIIQSYFAVPKNLTLNSTRYFIMKIPNKRELQQTAFNHSADTEFKSSINLYKKIKPYFFSD